MTNFQSHTLKVWTRRITSISVCTHQSEAAGVPGCYSPASLIQNRNDNRFKGLSGLGFGVIESAHTGFLSFFGFAKIRFLSHPCNCFSLVFVCKSTAILCSLFAQVFFILRFYCPSEFWRLPNLYATVVVAVP